MSEIISKIQIKVEKSGPCTVVNRQQKRLKISRDSIKNSPSIFMLNVYCFHEIFDWLSLKDLIAIGKTCKRLQLIAGDFFQMNYAAKSGRGENDGIYISSMQSNIFCRYIKKISISGDRLGAYQFIGSNCTDSIKHLRVYGFLPDGGFECITNILNGVEMLEMNESFIKGEFFEKHLKYCPNVKSLSVSRSGYIQDKSIVIGTDNKWMGRTYPKLIHFELTDSFELKSNELKIFFEQNPSIRTFSTDARSLWENRRTILNTNVKLDIFVINICQSKIVDANNQPISIKDSVYNILVELYSRGFYKRLHLYVYFVDQTNLDKMFSLSAIEMLNGDVVRLEGALTDLKTLAICYGDEILNMHNIPNKLLKLERIYFSEITSDRVLSFVCYSPKLRQIKIRRVKDGNHFKILDFYALNKKREHLIGARKVTVYIKEDLYLAIKMMNNTISFSLIELKRFETAEWEELSARSRYFKSF